MRVAGGDRCVVHALDRDAAIEEVAQRPDLRGVEFDALLIASILNRADCDGAGHAILSGARFDYAEFTDVADFEDVRFANGVSFARAKFTGPAVFRGARFLQARFDLAVFAAEAYFESAVFGDAGFTRATFAGAASFAGASFDGPARFADARFSGTTELTRLSLSTDADFARASFEDTTRIAGRVNGDLTMNDSRFGGLATIEIAARRVFMRDVLCEGQIDAMLDADEVSISRSRLERGGRIIVAGGRLTVEDARLARPTLIAAAGRTPPTPAPVLGDLAGADLAGTTLAGLDLTDTHFVGAHGLDGLRIDGRPALRRVGGGLSPQARRFVIADELDVRAQQSPAGADFEDVAAVYRDLRASHEGRKDEPGSADFYYGEMEMRRRAAAPLSAERAILETYRAVSGYGLRPSRSLLALAVLVLAATVAFHEILINHAPSWTATLLFALRSTVSFVREPTLKGTGLTAAYVQLLLRFAGPVLLALSAIAIRARVRR